MSNTVHTADRGKARKAAGAETGAQAYVPANWSRNIAPAAKYVTIFAGRNHHVCALKTEGWTAEQLEVHADLIASAPALSAEVSRLKEYETAAGMLAIEKAELRRQRDALSTTLRDLLEMCESIGRFSNGVTSQDGKDEGDYLAECRMQSARSALARATGETP